MNKTRKSVPSTIQANLDKFKLKPYVAVLDIETVGERIDSAVCTIGCVIKNIFTGKEIDSFYIKIDWRHQLSAKRNKQRRFKTKATMKWWQDQLERSPNAYNEVFESDSNRLLIKSALQKLNQFLRKHWSKRPQVMGNGPEFDNAMLAHAMRQYDIEPAWDFGCNQSLRTVVLLGRMLLGTNPRYDRKFEGEHHHALDDARNEAEDAFAIISELADRVSRLDALESAQGSIWTRMRNVFVPY